MSEPATEAASPGGVSSGAVFTEWSALFVLAALLVITLTAFGGATRIDNAIYDVALKLRQRPAPTDIVIVAVDFPSLSRQGIWPWPRAVEATMLRNIARDHPKAIACDILFQSSGPVQGDLAVRDAMRMAPVYLPEVVVEPGNGHAGLIARPAPIIREAAAGLGRTSATQDIDGLVRRAFFYVGYKGELVPELMLLVTGQTETQVADFVSHSVGATAASALSRRGEVLIPFAGPPGHYQQVSAADVVSGAVAPGTFKGKYVLVGGTAPGLLDNYPTPVSGMAGMPNVEVEANILDALLRHVLIRTLPLYLTLPLNFALVCIMFIGMLWLNPNRLAIQMPAITGLVLVSSIAGLVFLGVWYPPVPVVMTRLLVQLIWSSRRLKAASDYFARELVQLRSRPGGALAAAAGRGPGALADSMSRQIMMLDETRHRMRELRRFIDDVLATFPDPVFVITPRGRILAVNQAAVNLGQQLGRHTDPTSLVQPILGDLQVAAGGRERLWPPAVGPGATPPRGVGPGGRILEARYTATGVDSQGQAGGWTLHLMDVTAMVSAMRQREEALQLFTHDMRAPQSAILAALEHADFQSVPPTLRDSIARNAQRTLDLADSFVRLAMSEAAHYDFELIDLFHLISDAADAIWTKASLASVKLVLEDPEREFVVHADRRQMVRALINLLDNGIKFSPAGTAVTCSLVETTLRGRPAVSCAIADEATGISQEHQLNLFKRFACAPVATDSADRTPLRADGVGLGLTVVHTVVTRHDGVVDWRSEVGEGSVFTITLPLFLGEEAADLALAAT
jgi:CHASE2 domain-containing sensor protein/signal transduction histidine kinase